MSIDDLSRVELLRRIYDKMSDEEKRTFIMTHLNGRSNNEIMQALTHQSNELAEIHQKVNQNDWKSNFAANLAGNAIYGAATWLLGRLIGVIK